MCSGQLTAGLSGHVSWLAAGAISWPVYELHLPKFKKELHIYIVLWSMDQQQRIYFKIIIGKTKLMVESGLI